MNKKNLLKNKLIEIKNNNWNIPNDIDKFKLSLDMLENIGSIDMFLRDKLIYSVLNRELIENRKLSPLEMKKLLNLCLTEEHLFYGVGRVEDDSVFNRTFTMLAIDSIMRVNNEENMKFLNKDEVLDVYDKVMNYLVQEKDFRGYVDVKGWAHSTAHAADCLCNLAECEFIGHKELLEILKIIKDKICVDTYTYINEEDERVLNVFVSIYNRHILSIDEIIEWLKSFLDNNTYSKLPNDEHLRENRKIFLRSFYFRGKELNFEKEIMNTVEEVLSKLPAFY